MHVHLWRIVVTLLAVIALAMSTAAAAHGTATAEIEQVDSAETASDAHDDCEAVPSPHDANAVWAAAACASRHERPEDIDPTSDRPPPRG